MNHSFGYFEEDQLGTIKDLAIWLRLIRYLRPYWKGAVTAVFLSMLVIGASLTLPYLLRIAIDDYIINTDLNVTLRLSGIYKLGAIFLLVSALGFVANFFQVTILEWTGQHFMHDMRQELFKSLLEQDLSFFNNNPSGKLVTRLTNDIQNMHEMFTSVIITLFNDFLQLGGILIILFWLDWHLAGLMTIFLPIIVILSYFFSAYARDAFRSIRTGIARINSYLQESISGITVLQLCMREKYTENNFRKQNQQYYNKTLYQIKIFGFFMPLIEVLGTTSIAVVIFYGGSQILAGTMTLGVFTVYLFYMRLFFKPVRELSQKYSIVQSAMASAERIFELLDRKSELALPDNPIKPKSSSGQLDFEHVSFGYTPEETVIFDFNLTINKGESVAFVGPTGSGKSTIINLLERLYDPDKGSVYLDHHNLNQLDIKWLRNQIGLVLQEVIILPNTIRENIAFGSKVKSSKMQEILVKTQLEKVITNLPQGIETKIGEGGFQLSTGQKQLLSLARIMVRDPKILILDEATANIDSATEILLEKALRETMVGRTTIIIAHRLSTIKSVDRIIFIDKGRIVEQGNHHELIKLKGSYYHLKNGK